MYGRIALVLLLLETAASADPLADARNAVAQSDYLAARPALIAALDAGGRGPDDVAEIYRLTGIVEAALGDARAATDAFTRLLALAPKSTLPDGTSPKIRRPFDAAARFVASHAALEVKMETASHPPAITLIVVGDSLHMVATARAVFRVDGGAERTQDANVTGERTEVALASGRRIDAQIAALDAHGNRLVEIGSQEVPIVVLGDAPPAAPAAPVAPPPAPQPRQVMVRAEPRPVYLRWWPYAAAGTVALAAASYVGWSARSASRELQGIIADSEHHAFADATAVEHRARRDALIANIGFGVAGAFALVAGALYATAPRDHIETRVAAAPIPGGGALVLGGSF